MPLHHIFRLNSYNHFIERRFDLTIIEMNIALEELVTHALVYKLHKDNKNNEEINRILNRYKSTHEKLDRGYKDVFGVSLQENKKLWDKFNKVRLIRKNTVHPYVRKMNYEDAKEVIQNCNEIIEWIVQLVK